VGKKETVVTINKASFKKKRSKCSKKTQGNALRGCEEEEIKFLSETHDNNKHQIGFLLLKQQGLMQIQPRCFHHV